MNRKTFSSDDAIIAAELIKLYLNPILQPSIRIMIWYICAQIKSGDMSLDSPIYVRTEEAQEMLHLPSAKSTIDVLRKYRIRCRGNGKHLTWNWDQLFDLVKMIANVP